MKYGTILSLSVVICTITISLAELPLGTAPAEITLNGKCGGRLDKQPWSSNELKGKVFTLYYVDPDESDVNNDYYEALKKEDFPVEKTQSYAIINMKATWLPKSVVSAALKRKQKRYTKTIYVQDLCKTLVSAWNLKDDSSDNLVFDKDGNVIFSKDGKMTEEDIRKVIELIKTRIGD